MKHIHDTFPAQLNLDSGLSLTRDRSRLVLALKGEMDRKDLKRHLDRSALMLEDAFSPHVTGQAMRLNPRVHHTTTRYWIRSVNGRPISHAHTLSRQLHEQVDWVGPVYRMPKTKHGPKFSLLKDRAGLLALMPQSLILKIRAPQDDQRQLKRILDRYRLRAQRSKHLPDYLYCSPKPGTRKTICAIRQELLRREQPLVEEVLLDFMPMFIPTGFVPQDAYYSPDAPFPGYWGQWNMWRVEAGEDPHDPNAGSTPTGWDITTGHHSIVAIIDEGCDLAHPDLQAGYWTAPGALQPGATFDWDYSVSPPVVSMTEGGGHRGGGHGTWCAGIVGARMNNGTEGIAGLAPACQIMPLRIASWHATVVAEAIQYAADHGADVISMSFGGDATKGDYLNSPIMDTAIMNAASGQNAAHKKVVLCAATMNDDMEQICYPAAHPAVMAVGASHAGDERCTEEQWGRYYGSNYGNALWVMAPGVQIPTTANSSRGEPYYLHFFGTSAATPHVAGLAALLISRFATLRNNPDDVRRIIAESADKVGLIPYNQHKTHGRWNKQMGYGRINVRAALQQAMDEGLA